MTEQKTGFAYFKEVGIGAVAGVVTLGLIIAGYGLSGGQPPAAQPTATETPTATPSQSTSAATNARQCSVAEQVAAFTPERLQALVAVSYTHLRAPRH